MITDGSANLLSNNLYDAFGVLMYSSGSAATQWRFEGRFVEEEGLVASAGGSGDVLVARAVALSPPPKHDFCEDAYQACLVAAAVAATACAATAVAAYGFALKACTLAPPPWDLACYAAATLAEVAALAACGLLTNHAIHNCFLTLQKCERKHHGG